MPERRVISKDEIDAAAQKIIPAAFKETWLDLGAQKAHQETAVATARAALTAARTAALKKQATIKEIPVEEGANFENRSATTISY